MKELRIRAGSESPKMVAELGLESIFLNFKFSVSVPLHLSVIAYKAFIFLVPALYLEMDPRGFG